MKLKKVTILIAVVLIFTWLYKTEKDVFRRNIKYETATETAIIKSTEQYDDYTPDSINEQEANTSRNILQEKESVIQMTVPDSLTIKNSTGRILTNELCVGIAKEIFDATNAERIKAGIEPLIWDDELAKPADIRAEEIITNFSHIRDDGTKCYALSELIWGENIAKSPPNANGYDFVAHWMESDGHRENILKPQYTTIGIGIFCVEEGYTAVQLFGIDAIE